MFAFIVIPSVTGAGMPIPEQTRQHALDGVLSAFCARCGGATVVQGHGAWKPANGPVVHEPVTIVEAYVPDDTDLLWLAGLARQLQLDLAQDSVMYGARPGSAWFT